MLTCLKCDVAFESRPAASTHYRSKWHEYNLMRALNLLPPVSEASYDAAYQQLVSNQESAQLRESYSCVPCRKSFSSLGSYNSHLKSRRHSTTVASVDRTNPDILISSPDAKEGLSSGIPKQPSDDGSESQDMADDCSETREQTNKERLDASIQQGSWPCVLCALHFPSAASAMLHACRQHSLVVPHLHTCDLAALYDTVAAIVLCQQRCLQCGKPHATLRSCQRHMRHKPHLTLPLPGPYDHCYSWPHLETSVILPALATAECFASGDQLAPDYLKLPTGTVAASRRSAQPRRSKAAVVAVTIRRRAVAAKPSHGGGMAVAVVHRKRRELYGRKPAHARRPVTKNLHKVVLPC